MNILPESEWRARGEAHERRVRPWIGPRLARMSRGEKHPVEDFLFDYYPYRPAQLLRWHPGLGVALGGASAEEYLHCKGYGLVKGGVAADPSQWPERRTGFLHWLRDMLAATAQRPASFGCFGLHEWAMVYRSETVRHGQWPLRLSPDSIAAAVESLGLRCTHYDAFRFFTPPAAPLNKFQPARATTSAFEQPGCLHANMDLYKWAFKLSPFSPSELVADAFALAREIRVLDMRASPYDFRALGYEPVRIETPEGRAEYEEAQRGFSRRAAPLRRRLITLCEELLASLSEYA